MRVAGDLGDLIHLAEQLAVVADDHHHPGPGRYRVVEAPARVQVEVVGRLVEQQHGGAPQEQRGQADQDRLAAGQLPDRVVEAERAEAEAVQPGAGALLHVPVAVDRGEGVIAGLARLDRVQRGPGGGDAEQVGHGGVGAERDGLRQVADVALDAHRAGARVQLTGDEPEQGRLARPVDADEAGPAGAERGGQVREDGGTVGPAKTEV